MNTHTAATKPTFEPHPFESDPIAFAQSLSKPERTHPPIPTAPPQQPHPSSPNLSRIIDALLDPTVTPTDLCSIFNLTLSELADILESDPYHRALENLKRIDRARSALIDSHSESSAKATLLKLTTDNPLTPTERETARKAASAILKKNAAPQKSNRTRRSAPCHRVSDPLHTRGCICLHSTSTRRARQSYPPGIGRSVVIQSKPDTSTPLEKGISETRLHGAKRVWWFNSVIIAMLPLAHMVLVVLMTNRIADTRAPRGRSRQTPLHRERPKAEHDRSERPQGRGEQSALGRFVVGVMGGHGCRPFKKREMLAPLLCVVQTYIRAPA